MSGVEYHSNDFDFDSWSREAQEHILAGSSSEEDRESLTEASDLIYGDVWDDFYTQQGKSAYQVRRYIMEEFSSYFLGTSKSLKIIDVGAGVGSTAVALLRGQGPCRGARFRVQTARGPRTRSRAGACSWPTP